MTERSDTDTRPSLLVRIRDSKDAVAWAEFVRVYTPLVYRHCRRAGLQSADAAEVVQETFAQVVRSIRTFSYDPIRGRFRSWLGSVVRSRLSRLFTKAAHAPDLVQGPVLDQPGAPVDPGWVDDFNAHIATAALARIRDEFEPGHWQVFEGVWREDRPVPEVADECRLSVPAVYVIKSRILRRLWDEVRHLTDDVPFFAPGRMQDKG